MAPKLSFHATDLAPGDVRNADVDLSAFSFHRIRGLDDPLFETAYAALWAEFGAKAEMETREVLAGRWQLGGDFLYEMILALHDGEVAAVRDCTAIRGPGGIVVHLSHILVAPAFRRAGLAAWMRAFPIQTARELDAHAAITLVGEMEYDDASDPARAVRLTAYQRAGFLKIDPARVRYFQPDFRPSQEIDAAGGPQPLAFQLIVRRFRREDETAISAAEVRAIVAALYRMYGPQFRPQDMAHPLLDLARFPDGPELIPLLPPTTPC